MQKPLDLSHFNDDCVCVDMHQMQKRMDKLRKQPNDVVYSPVVHQIQGLIAALAQAKDSRDPLRRQLTELIGSVQHYTEQLEKQKTDLTRTLNDAINRLVLEPVSWVVGQVVRQFFCQAVS